MCTDYITAVFLDGLTRCNELIVTEWPMGHTLPDFWSMVYAHDVSSVVVLDNPPASSKFPAIWPEPGRQPVLFWENSQSTHNLRLL